VYLETIKALTLQAQRRLSVLQHAYRHGIVMLQAKSKAINLVVQRSASSLRVNQQCFTLWVQPGSMWGDIRSERTQPMLMMHNA